MIYHKVDLSENNKVIIPDLKFWETNLLEVGKKFTDARLLDCFTFKKFIGLETVDGYDSRLNLAMSIFLIRRYCSHTKNITKIYNYGVKRNFSFLGLYMGALDLSLLLHTLNYRLRETENSYCFNHNINITKLEKITKIKDNHHIFNREIENFLEIKENKIIFKKETFIIEPIKMFLN
jgi:hypothetical protein